MQRFYSCRRKSAGAHCVLRHPGTDAERTWITPWMEWFLGCLGAPSMGRKPCGGILARRASGTPSPASRQRPAALGGEPVARRLRGEAHHIEVRELAECSQDTALATFCSCRGRHSHPQSGRRRSTSYALRGFRAIRASRFEGLRVSSPGGARLRRARTTSSPRASAGRGSGFRPLVRFPRKSFAPQPNGKIWRRMRPPRSPASPAVAALRNAPNRAPRRRRLRAALTLLSTWDRVCSAAVRFPEGPTPADVRRDFVAVAPARCEVSGVRRQPQHELLRLEAFSLATSKVSQAMEKWKLDR